MKRPFLKGALEALVILTAAGLIVWYATAGTDGHPAATNRTPTAHTEKPSTAIAAQRTTIAPSPTPAVHPKRTPTIKRAPQTNPAQARPAHRVRRPRSSSEGELPLKRHSPAYLPRTGAGQ